MNELEELLVIINQIKSIKTSHLNIKFRVDLFNQLSDIAYRIIDISHPILNVKLISSSSIKNNDYNPNVMAPPEYKLLKQSIKKDGLTMPIVVSKNDNELYNIIDGSHRVKIIKNNLNIKNSFHSYIPTIILTKNNNDSMASSVRHNIARGVHQVELTSNLIIKLKQSSWTNEKICQELGMEPDEVLRMQQITGLAHAYKDEDFSFAWR